jgi:hypothetical protein
LSSFSPSARIFFSLRSPYRGNAGGDFVAMNDAYQNVHSDVREVEVLPPMPRRGGAIQWAKAAPAHAPGP